MRVEPEARDEAAALIDAARAEFTTGLREDIIEALNTKTAAFVLAFIPQFVDLSADVAAQFAWPEA